jgi:basic membrane protein A
MIIGVGEEWTQPEQTAGPQFPNVHFAVINGNSGSGNVAGVRLDQWPLGYLAGVLAAVSTKSGVVGDVQGVEFTSTDRIKDGFEKGAKSVNPSIKVLSVFTGDFSDPAKGKEAAAAMISQGADVLVSALDLGTPGVIEAAKAKPGVHLIGFFTDQGHDFNEPSLYLSSAIASWPAATKEIVDIEAKGQFEGKLYTFSVQESKFAYLAPFGPDVTADAQAKVQAALDQFRSGQLVSPATP